MDVNIFHKTLSHFNIKHSSLDSEENFVVIPNWLPNRKLDETDLEVLNTLVEMNQNNLSDIDYLI